MRLPIPGPRVKKIASWAGQIALVIALVVIIGKWQTRDLVDPGSRAPILNLETLDGKPFTLQPADRTILYFFAPWCSVCALSSSSVNSLRSSEPAEKLAVYAVALSWKSRDEVRQFTASHGLTVPVLMGTDETGRAFKISSFPTFYFIDRNGLVTGHVSGYTTAWGLKIRSYFGL